MSVIRGFIVLLAVLPASVGLAQEPLCDPCIDPPQAVPVTKIPPPELRPDETDHELRDIGTFFRTRTLTLVNSHRISGEAAKDSGVDDSDDSAAVGGDSDDEASGSDAEEHGSADE